MRLHKIALCALFSLAMLFSLSALAQDASPVTEDNPLLQLLNGWLGKAGLSVAALIGLLRMIFKPVMLAVQSFTQTTPSTADDLVLERLQASKGWKLLCWLVDYTTSIKIGTERPIPVEAMAAPVVIPPGSSPTDTK